MKAFILACGLSVLAAAPRPLQAQSVAPVASQAPPGIRPGDTADPNALVYSGVKNVTAGAVFQNPISFAGDSGRAKVNELIIAPTLTYSLSKGWFAGLADYNWTFDWENGGEATLPLGVQVGRILRIGHQPFNVSVEVGRMAARPADTPDPGWILGFEFSPIFNFHLGPGQKIHLRGKKKSTEETHDCTRMAETSFTWRVRVLCPGRPGARGRAGAGGAAPAVPPQGDPARRRAARGRREGRGGHEAPAHHRQARDRRLRRREGGRDRGPAPGPGPGRAEVPSGAPDPGDGPLLDPREDRGPEGPRSIPRTTSRP